MTEIFKISSMYYRYLIPLGNGEWALHLPIIQGHIVQSLVEIGTMVLEKKMKI